METIQHKELLARNRVPNDYFVVKAVGGQDVGGTGMPQNMAALSGVSNELLLAVHQSVIEALIGDGPDLNGAVLRAGGYLVVVERVPGYVHNQVLVSRHFWDVEIKSPNLMLCAVRMDMRLDS